MSPLFRAALAWILALALPLQGLAAATMLNCAPEPGVRAAAAAQPHAGHHGAAAHAPAVLHDPAALHDGAAAHVPAAGHGHGAHAGDDAGADDAHQCSACAACVAGPALPSTVATSTPIDPACPVVQAPLPRLASVVLAGLERPPRSALA
jgi:hypothetical protein